MFSADFKMLKFVFLSLLSSLVVGCVNVDKRTDEYCMKSVNHKKSPSAMEDLFGECARWKNNSCCTWNTSVEVNRLNLYKFDYDHCSAQGKPNISENCRRYFVLDLCLIECSPDLGFWLLPDDHRVRTERAYKVPLCASECNAWFEACKNDYTCTTNWAHSFDWSSGTNKCLLGKSCRTIFDEFQTAKNFCEQIWDGSWVYTDDSLPCMNLTFDENEPNPNTKVSEFYAQAKCSADQGIVPYFWGIVISSLFFVMYAYSYAIAFCFIVNV